MDDTNVWLVGLVGKHRLASSYQLIRGTAMKHIGVSAMSRRPKLLVRVRSDEHKDTVISLGLNVGTEATCIIITVDLKYNISRKHKHISKTYNRNSLLRSNTPKGEYQVNNRSCIQLRWSHDYNAGSRIHTPCSAEYNPRTQGRSTGEEAVS